MSRKASLQPGSYVLTHLDVYDWGAFSGRHGAQIDLAGTAIIGPTGSGKTTLVDALMTLLVAAPRYNLASTGGHESDRDLVSYIRGVSGAGNDGDGNEHVARPGAVVTGIAARFSDGESVVRIGGLFWFDGSSSAVADLKRRWLFCQNDAPGLDAWLEALHDGGVRALKEQERSSPGLKIYDTKQAYLSRLRGQFEVGENAFALLNRAAGLKQLNSIDTVFRELVLEDRSAFEAARNVVDEFDTLAGIRAELETARKQRDSLLPIAAGWRELEKHRAERDELGGLKALLPRWFAQQAALRWNVRADEVQHRLAQLGGIETALSASIEQTRRLADDAHAAYIKAGGGDIERLRGQIDTQKTLVASRKRAAQDYQARAAALGMPLELTATCVKTNLDSVAQLRTRHEQELHDAQQAAWALGAARLQVQQRHTGTAQEIAEVRKRPGSNIPVPQQYFRRDLATHLGLNEDDIPFVAELVEVKPEERSWRGAVERAIGGERLRLLVDPLHASAALAWINARDNRLHVRIHETAAAGASARFLDDGFTRKLNFKAHPLREALKHLLSGIDRHCVADVAALRDTPHAMTAEGLLSGRRNYFDKHDLLPLDQGWMTGFDNRDRIAALDAALEQLQQELNLASAKERQAQQQSELLRKSLALLEAVGNTVFDDIDLPSAQAELDRLELELVRFSDPQSDATQAHLRWESAKAVVDALLRDEVQVKAEVRNLADQSRDVQTRLERLAARIAPGLDSRDHDLAAQHFASLDGTPLDEFDETERRRGNDLQLRLDGINNRCANAEKRLVGQMKDAKQIDTGYLIDTGSDLPDVPDFLERLRVLNEEALPEKLTRFLNYLNQSSEQGVTQLLSEIDNETSVIEERIAGLNATLERVDFQPGRYLRLEPQRVEHESLRTLQRARARLRSDQLKDDLGESHYAALFELVNLLRDAADRRKTLGALALLDPRYRLQFAVLVIERGSGKVIEKRTSSQGGSGGEKEIIASYVLTASLSYALCPQGSERPLFGSIVLDEAFSKSSQAVAGRIIRALSEFGLHPLFVTPNKELRLLREHTRSAIVVHRKGAQATMTTLSWEELEAHARSRAARKDLGDEVA